MAPAPRRPRATALLSFLAPALLFVLLAAPQAAWGQTIDTLVSTINQARGTTRGNSSDFAQAFTTGTNSGGYKLTAVDVAHTFTGTGALSTYTVEIWSDSSGAPNTRLATLTVPDNPSAGNVRYEASGDGIDLTASTTYHFVLDTEARNDLRFSVRTTNSGNEDSNSLPGWSVANNARRRPFNNSGNYTQTSGPLLLDVRGYEVSSDATLSNLVVEVGGTEQTLSPPFTSDGENYILNVGAAFTSVDVTATVNHSGASLEGVLRHPPDFDAQNVAMTSGTAVTLPLVPGANPFAITVTAQDSTTKPYGVGLYRLIAPVVTLTPSDAQSIDADTDLALSVTATDSDGSIESYTWAAALGSADVTGDVLTVNPTDDTKATFNASTGGEYEVSVTAVDDNNASTTASITVTVAGPVTPVEQPGNVVFSSGSSTYQEEDAAGSVCVEVTWTGLEDGDSLTQDLLIPVTVSGASNYLADQTQVLTVASGTNLIVGGVSLTRDLCFTVADDGVYDSAQTGTFTLEAASHGQASGNYVLGSTVTHTVSFADRDATPVASINPSGPLTVAAGENLALDGLGSSDPDATDVISAYEWVADDGTNTVTGTVLTVDTNNAGRVTFTAATPGEYTVTLTVTDDENVVNLATLAVTVTDAPSVTLVLAPASIGEDGGTSRVTASLNAAVGSATTVTVTATPGAGAVTEDFTRSGTTLTIAAGATVSTGTVTITAVNNDVDTADKEVTVSGTAAGGVTSDPTSVTLTITDDDVRGVTVSKPSVTPAEPAGTDTYTVVLDSEPTANVTVSIASDNTAVVTVAPSTLTFTSSNWSTERTVTVTAVNDNVENDPARGTVIFNTVASSGDYSVVNGDAVGVTVLDDDGAPMVRLVLTPERIDESGSGNVSTVTASLTKAVTSSTTVTVAASPGTGTTTGDFTLSGATTLTIAANALTSTGTVTITAVDNSVDAADKSVTVSGTATGGVTNNPADVTLTITDDDTRGVTISKTAVTVAEPAGTDTYTVVLDTRPTTAVRVAPTSGATSAATVAPATLTFTASNWSSAQTVTVTAVDDAVDNDPNRATSITHAVRSSGGYNNVAAGSVDVTVLDDDGVVLNLLLAPASIGENGGVSRVTASLTEAVSAATTLTVTASPDTGAVAADFMQSGTTLTIAANATTSTGTVTITAVDNSVDAADKSVTVSATASGGVSIAPAAKPLTITDDDTRGVTVSKSSVSVAEPSGTDTYTVELDTEPTANVTVAVTSGDSTVATVAPATLTFTGSNWSTAQTVTVRAVDDSILNAENRGTAITHTVASTGDYNGEPANVVGVTVPDDEGTRSGDATLSNLTMTDTSDSPIALDQTFASDRTAYTVSVAMDVTSVKVTAVVNDDNARLAGSLARAGSSDPVSVTMTSDTAATLTGLATGENVLTIRVTAENGGTQDYTLTVKQVAPPTASIDPSGNATVQANTDLVLDGSDSEDPDGGALTYAWAASDGTNVVTSSVFTGSVTGATATFNTATLGDYTVTLTVTDDENVTAEASLTVTVTAAPVVTLVLSPVSIAESGATNVSTVTASLNVAVASATTVTVASSPGTGAVDGDFTQSGTTLTIAGGATASTGAVTITAVNNSVDAADKEVTVSGTATGGVETAPASVTLTITDDDVRGVALSESVLTLAEAGGSDTYTVALTSEPTAEVTVTVASSDETTATVSAGTLTFTSSDWNTAQTVTVSAVNDDVDNPGNRTTSITHTVASTGDYSSTDADSVGVTVTDDEGTAVLTLALSPSKIAESGDTTVSTVTASLNLGVGSDTTVTVTATAGANAVAADFMQAGTTLTIAAGATVSTGTVTITAQDNDVDTADKSVTVAGVATGGVSTNPSSVTLTIEDDDTRGVTISETGVTVAEPSGTATYTVVLDSEPTAEVTVTAASGDATAAMVSPATLTFTSIDWATEQTVTVSAVDDALDNAADRTTSIGHTVGSTGDYSGATAASVDVTVTDNEAAAALTLSLSPSTIDEGGTTTVSTVTATLNAAVGTATMVTVTATAGTNAADGDFLLAGSTLTIAANSTTSTGTVTITAVDNAVDTDDKEVTVAGAATGGVTTNPASVKLTIRDDDTRGVTVSETGLTLAEAAGTGTYTVALDSEPTDDVTVAVSSGAETVATVSADTLTFTSTTWDTAQTVTVTAVDDNVDNDPDRTTTVSHTVASDGDYSGETAASLDVTVTDDEGAAAVTLLLSPTSISESGATTVSTVTASVNVAVSADTTVTVEATAGTNAVDGDFTQSGTTLTIAANALTSTGTVTITAVDDDLDAGDKEVTVSGAASGGVDDDPTAVTLTIRDDDTRGVTVSETGLTLAEAAGTGTYTVALDSEPTDDVTVAVSSGAATVATVSVDTLTFTSTTWNTAQTVTVTAVDDNVDNDPDRTTTISHTVESSGDYSAVTAASLDVTVTDDEGAATVTLLLSPSSIDETGDTTVSTVTASLNAAVSADTTVTVEATAGTGAVDGDFTQSGTTLTIAANATTSTGVVTITAADNDVDTDDKEVTVAGTATGGVTTNPASVTLTITDDDTRGVTISETELTLAEAAGTGTYSVELDSEPTADVTVEVASGDATVATVSADTLTFTSTTWSTAQTVTVTAVADGVDNPQDRTTTVTHTVASGGDYSGETAASIDVTITDDDTRGVGISQQRLTLAEAAGTDTYTVVLGSLPTADVTVTVASGDETVATVSADTLTFTTSDWSTAQTVTVTAVDDNVDNDPDRTTSISHTVSATGGYTGVTADPVAVTVTDDEGAAAVTLVLSTSSIKEGENMMGDVTSATVTATLNTPAGAATTVTVTATAGTGAVAGDFTQDGTTLTIAGGATVSTGTVTITAVDNDVDTADKSVTVSGVATGGVTTNPASLTLTIMDDDTRGVTVSTDDVTVSEPAGTDTYTIVLTSEPTAEVTVAAASGDETAATVAPATLTFTASDWSTAQTLTVSAVNDNLDNSGDRTTTIDHTVASTGDYTSASAASVDVTVEDDDATRTVTLLLTPSTIGESGATTVSTVTASLDAAVGEATTVTVSASPGTGAVAGDFELSGTTLTIAANATTSTGVVTITAVNNDVDTDDKSVIVSGTASGGVSNNPADVTLTITDDDTRGVTVSESAVTVGEPDGTDTYTVVLESEPTADVTVTVASGDATAATVAPAALTFTASDWATAQTVTVSAVNDDVNNAGNRTTTITHAVASTGDYSGAAAASVGVTVTDDDGAAAVTLLLSPSTIGESGDTTVSQVTASLNLAVTGAVTVTVTASPGAGAVDGDFMQEGTALTIAAGATVSTGAVTITAVDNDVDTDDKSVTVSATASGGVDTNPADVTLVITDDDTRGVTVSESALTVSEPDGAAMYTVVLESEPTSPVTVTPASGDAGAATVSGALTFTADDWDAPQTVTVTAVDDDARNEPGRATTITHAVASTGDYAAESAADVAVTVQDDDLPAGLVFMPASLSVAEAGGEGRYTVSLTSAPTGAVTVSVMSRDTSVATVMPAALTFNADNWDMGQSVTVTGVDDSMHNQPERTTQIAHSASGGGYDAVAGAVQVTAVDDEDAPAPNQGPTVSIDQGASRRVAVGTDLALSVTASDPDGQIVRYAWTALEGGNDVTGTVLTASATATPTFRADAVGTYQVTVRVTDDDGATATATLTVTVADPTDVMAAVTVSTAALSVAEAGGTATYTVVLEAEPSGPVTVTATSGDAGVATVDPAALTFTGANWNMAQTVMVMAVDDSIDNAVDRMTAVQHEAAGGGYGGVAIDMVAVTVVDDDEAGVMVMPSALEIREGATATYTVALATEPAAAAVTVMAASDDAEVATVNPAALTFTAANWSTAQTVTVMAVDDGMDDAMERITAIRHAVAGAGYDGVTVGSVSVTVTAMGAAEVMERVEAVQESVLPPAVQLSVLKVIDTIGNRVQGGGQGSGQGGPSSLENFVKGLLTEAGAAAGSSRGARHWSAGDWNGDGWNDGGFGLDGFGDGAQRAAGGFSQALHQWSLGASDGAGGGAPTTLWLRASHDNLSLSGASDVNWEGDQSGFHAGVDRQIREGLIAGIGASWVQGDFDYTSGMGAPGDGSLSTSTLNLYPYVGWTPGGRLNLWGALGYGFGELEVTEDGLNEKSDTTQWMAALGGGFRVVDRGPVRVDLKAEFWTAQIDVEGNDAHIGASTLDMYRGRLLAEVSRDFPLENATLAPSVGLALRQDGGDGTTGGGVELNAGIAYDHRRGLSLRAEGRHLLSYDLEDGAGDLEEWGVSGAVLFRRAASRMGPSLSLTQSLGDVSGGVEQLWSAGALPRAAGAATLGLRTDARFEYGFAGTRRFREITPYVQMSRYGDTQSYGLGAHWMLGAMKVELSLDRREATADPEHAIGLRLHWTPGAGLRRALRPSPAAPSAAGLPK